jgi:prepilin-type processing-associated H-X9-DG protein
MPYRQDSIDAYARDGADFREPVRLARWTKIVAGVVLLTLGTWAGIAIRDARRRAGLERCAANLKQIGQAILLYANANGNRYPDSFATLMRLPPRDRDGQSIGLAAFACPASGETPPTADAADGGGYRLIADTMPASLSIAKHGRVYDGLRLAEECVAIEVPGRHGDGVHVLLADGHVEFRTLSTTRSATWLETQDDVYNNRPIRWPASQPWR